MDAQQGIRQRAGRGRRAKRGGLRCTIPPSGTQKGDGATKPPVVRHRSFHLDPSRGAYCDFRKSWSRGGPIFGTIFQTNRGDVLEKCHDNVFEKIMTNSLKIYITFSEKSPREVFAAKTLTFLAGRKKCAATFLLKTLE